MKHKLAQLIWGRLSSLMPEELHRSELGWLLWSRNHLQLLTHRRAPLIINRVRLFAFLFAVLTPVWSIIDFLVFPFSLWLTLAVLRGLATLAFTLLVTQYRPSGNRASAYWSLAILFAIPTVFYIASHVTLHNYELSGLSAAIGTGYAFLPFVLLAGMAIFPLTMAESLLFALPMLVAQAASGWFQWSAMNWPTFAGSFWLLLLITGTSTLAGLSQLAFMIVLVGQAVRDPLTGVFSRRSGEEVMDMQFVLSMRSNAPLALAFIDLDHFKQVNDGYGHEAGDAVLRTATMQLSTHLRRGDMIARWGGEEFILIMPNTDLTQAQQALERLRQIGFGHRPEGKPVTASIGLAERMADGTPHWHALVEKADVRMYRAKETGRDRIISADA